MLSSFEENKKMPRIIIRQRKPQTLGVFELSTDEQIAKKIYEATGDKVFKGFLPLTWNTKIITQMKDIYQRLTDAGKLSALNMAYQLPTVSQAAHQYFITNWKSIKAPIPNIIGQFKPVLWIAGAGIAAVILIQVAPLFKSLIKPKQQGA
jgi:hypothetical protein